MSKDFFEGLSEARDPGFKRALILNFGTGSLQYERVVLGA